MYCWCFLSYHMGVDFYFKWAWIGADSGENWCKEIQECCELRQSCVSSCYGPSDCKEMETAGCNQTAICDAA